MVTAALVAQRRSRPRTLWIVALLLLSLMTAGIWFYRREAVGDKKSSNGDQWILPHSTDIAATVNATGTVRLKTGAEVRVGAQVSGIVRKLNVTVGSIVHQNDVIAVIDSRSIQARIDQSQSQLVQSQVTLAKAETDDHRTSELYQAGLIPRQQFDDATASLKSARAAVRFAESGVRAARVDLEYVQIRAPIAGTVASVSTQQGETVAAAFSTPTFVTIIQPSALEVVAMVDEADIGNVKVSQHATFTVESYPDHEFLGTVMRLAPAATIVSGVVNYEVVTSIQEDINMLRPDMTANVTILLAKHRAIFVPAASLHKEEGRDYVEAKTDTTALVKRRVTLGARMGTDVEITSGLSPESMVRVRDESAGKQ